jgi:hypothetical protein
VLPNPCCRRIDDRLILWDVFVVGRVSLYFTPNPHVSQNE